MTLLLVATQPVIVGGIDAHKDTHHAVVLDSHGVRLADQAFPATQAGYQDVLTWMADFRLLARVGIESTGSSAAGLTRHLIGMGIGVFEVNTPHPHTRAREGKDDTIDAEAAARKVLAGEATTRSKLTTGAIESIRMLTLAKNSAVKTRTRRSSNSRTSSSMPLR